MVITPAEQIESSSGSSFMLVRMKHKMSSCLFAYLQIWSLLILCHLAQSLPQRLSMLVAKSGQILPKNLPENSLKPEAIRSSHQNSGFKDTPP